MTPPTLEGRNLKSIENLMDELSGVRFAAEVLLDREAREILLDWWTKSEKEKDEAASHSRRRGRVSKSAPLVDYVESEEERRKIIALTGKERGAWRLVAEAMSKTWKITPGAAEKRIRASRKAMGKL